MNKPKRNFPIASNARTAFHSKLQIHTYIVQC